MQLTCVALNVYHEARGESVAGMRAVAHVTMNRVEDPKFPEKPCRVVRQGGEDRLHDCQFSWYCDGAPDRPGYGTAWEMSVAVAAGALFGLTPDPTQGACWYHTLGVDPYWNERMRRVVRIGNHVFWRRPDARSAQLAHAGTVPSAVPYGAERSSP